MTFIAKRSREPQTSCVSRIKIPMGAFGSLTAWGPIKTSAKAPIICKEDRELLLGKEEEKKGREQPWTGGCPLVEPDIEGSLNQAKKETETQGRIK